MPTYKDGQEARVSDVVFGHVDHRPYPVLGIVSALDDDQELNTHVISLLGILVDRNAEDGRITPVQIHGGHDDIATCSNLYRLQLDATP